MCQNTIMRVNGACIKIYCVLCSKTYNTLQSCHNFPAGSWQAARGTRICETSLLWVAFISDLLSNLFSRCGQRMMTSSNGNIFRVTGPLCGEFTGPGEFPTQRPVTRSFDVIFDLRLNKRLSKQPRGWWFETPSCPFWRHGNGWNYLFQLSSMVISWNENASCTRTFMCPWWLLEQPVGQTLEWPVSWNVTQYWNISLGFHHSSTATFTEADIL